MQFGMPHCMQCGMRFGSHTLHATLPHTAARCRTLPHTAAHCRTLPHTACTATLCCTAAHSRSYNHTLPDCRTAAHCHTATHLEQVASIIQLHNKGQRGCNIVTTLLQGTERKDWDMVWKHMRVAEEAATEMTGMVDQQHG